MTVTLDPSCVDCVIALFDNTGTQLSPCWNNPSCMLDPDAQPYEVVVTDPNSGCSALASIPVSIVFVPPVSN